MCRIVQFTQSGIVSLKDEVQNVRLGLARSKPDPARSYKVGALHAAKELNGCERATILESLYRAVWKKVA
jgi:hypothetical protein